MAGRHPLHRPLDCGCVPQFGVGGDFEGFRYATQAEVATFFENAGLTVGGSSPAARSQVFTGLVGVTQSSPGFERTVGRVSTESSPGQHFAPDVGTSGGGGFANPSNCCAPATDANPNAGSWLLRIPGLPPAPTITAMPANPTNQTSASFSFIDSETGVSFLCEMDDGGFSPCSTGKTYSGLSQGSHTFSVKSQDTVGNQGPAASFTWTMTP